MTPESYDRFTTSLRDALARDERVVGLVALGSMAARDYVPDRWSDHDFFVVVRSGEQETFRRDLSWLPGAGGVVLSFRETAHGMKVLYRDGRLLEFAVFDHGELALARVNRARVLLDRGGVAEAVAAVRSATGRWVATAAESDELLFGQFLTNLLVGCGRYARGERLSGGQFVKGHAARHLTVLLARHVPAAGASLLDDLDPLRRFERVYPEIGAEIGRLLDEPAPECARGLLALAARELDGRLRSYPSEAVAAVARAIAV